MVPQSVWPSQTAKPISWLLVVNGRPGRPYLWGMTSEQRESITVAVVWSINVHTVICCGPELKSCPQKAARIASMFCLTGWAPLLAKHTKAVSDSQPRSCFWSSNYFKLNHSDSSIFFPSEINRQQYLSAGKRLKATSLLIRVQKIIYVAVQLFLNLLVCEPLTCRKKMTTKNSLRE